MHVCLSRFYPLHLQHVSFHFSSEHWPEPSSSSSDVTVHAGQSSVVQLVSEVRDIHAWGWSLFRCTILAMIRFRPWCPENGWHRHATEIWRLNSCETSIVSGWFAQWIQKAEEHWPLVYSRHIYFGHCWCVNKANDILIFVRINNNISSENSFAYDNNY